MIKILLIGLLLLTPVVCIPCEIVYDEVVAINEVTTKNLIDIK